ncbi:MAG TPA: cytochrome c maturation protein CcmE [Gemmatimonadota bacterium]|nr:cytochrome c maturation protein CcmE [Gemmatimonadota bacterium]
MRHNQETRFGRLAIAITLVAGALAVLVFLGTRQNLTYYYEIDELAAATAETKDKVRVSGDVVEGSIVRHDADRTVRFDLRGTAEPGSPAAAPGARLPVVYSGTLPDIFRPGIQVVVEGRLDADGTFRAETLLAKCPSKYQAAGELGGPAAPPRS